MRAVEVEVLVVEGVGKVARFGGEEVVAEIGLEGGGVDGVELIRQLGPEVGGGVVNLGDARRVDGVFKVGEAGAGEGGEGFDGLEVIGLLRLAHVDDAERSLGECGLQSHDVCRVNLGLGGRAAGEGEHLGDVSDVLGANLGVLVAGAQVVVLLRQAEAALLDEGDLLGGVLEVLLLAVAEEGVDADALELADECGELGVRVRRCRCRGRRSRRAGAGWA